MPGFSNDGNNLTKMDNREAKVIMCSSMEKKSKVLVIMGDLHFDVEPFFIKDYKLSYK